MQFKVLHIENCPLILNYIYELFEDRAFKFLYFYYDESVKINKSFLFAF